MQNISKWTGMLVMLLFSLFKKNHSAIMEKTFLTDFESCRTQQMATLMNSSFTVFRNSFIDKAQFFKKPSFSSRVFSLYDKLAKYDWSILLLYITRFCCINLRKKYSLVCSSNSIFTWNCDFLFIFADGVT